VKNESVLVETVDYKIQAQSIESSKCLLSFSRFSECQQKSQISEGRFVALFWVVLTEGLWVWQTRRYDNGHRSDDSEYVCIARVTTYNDHVVECFHMP